MNKKLMILICSFSTLTLISSIVCSSLIFLNEKARTEVNGSEVLAVNNIYKSTSIIYNQNNTLNISNIKPGYELSQNFTIVNNNSNTIKYDIKWSNIISTWNMDYNGDNSNPNNFVYTLKCTNGEQITNKKMPINDNEIILDDLELKTNKTNECTISVYYLNDNNQDVIEQSYYYNNSFRGTYKIEIKE